MPGIEDTPLGGKKFAGGIGFLRSRVCSEAGRKENRGGK
jgi:hypothetical protein